MILGDGKQGNMALDGSRNVFVQTEKLVFMLMYHSDDVREFLCIDMIRLKVGAVNCEML